MKRRRRHEYTTRNEVIISIRYEAEPTPQGLQRMGAIHQAPVDEDGVPKAERRPEMIATKSYIDINGQVIIDGQPLQFVRRPQNLKAAPSRHRKQPEQIDQKAYIRSVADAAASLLLLMLSITAMGVVLAIIKY